MKTIDLVATTDEIMRLTVKDISKMPEVERFKSRVYLSVRLQKMFGIPVLLRDDGKYSEMIGRYGEQIDALGD